MLERQPDMYNTLFLDIETVPQTCSLSEMPERLVAAWHKKLDKAANGEEEPDYEGEYCEKAALQAEFGKVVCISVGLVRQDKATGKPTLYLKSYAGADENRLLNEFAQMVKTLPPSIRICGHNIKGFDMPFICRRMIINQIAIPTQINAMGKKPWEVNYDDTLEMWKFGGGSACSLDLLTAVFDIPTPKDDINGSQVAEVFYKTGDIGRISTYCQKDVLATTQVYLRMKGSPLIADNCIVYM